MLEAVAEDETLAARYGFMMITAAVELAESGRIAALRNYLGAPLLPKPFKPALNAAAIDDTTRRLHANRQGILKEDSIRIASYECGFGGCPLARFGPHPAWLRAATLPQLTLGEGLPRDVRTWRRFWLWLPSLRRGGAGGEGLPGAKANDPDEISITSGRRSQDTGSQEQE